MKLRHGVNPVYVEWIDSVGTSGWHPKSAAEHPSIMTCVTVGNLISKTKDRLIISLSTSQYQHGDIMEIPVIAVTKIKKLRI